MGVRTWISGWPVYRQLTGTDPLGRGAAAKSGRSMALTARTETADSMARSVCPYCAVGCGQRVYVKDGQVSQIEGDPDSPISRGRLCPKGAASKNLVTSELRQQKVQYRRPWSERKAYVWWDEQHGEWTGHDVPDFEKTKAPGYRPPAEAKGTAALAGDDAFIMQGDGKAWLYVPTGLIDGPLPAHYEPAESPMRNALYGQQANPTRKAYQRPDNQLNPSPPEPHSEVFPYVFAIGRLTEHHTAGGMSRNVQYLSELQPTMFVEVSPELAAERDLHHLGWAHLVTLRSAIEARVLVTDRITPLRVDGRVLHQVWLPYHWGGQGLTRGDSTNDLFGIVLDPNVLIQESKVGTCDIRPGRRPTGPALRGYIADYQQRAGVRPQRQSPIVTTDSYREG